MSATPNTTYKAHVENRDWVDCQLHTHISSSAEASERPPCRIFYDLAVARHTPPDVETSSALEALIAATTSHDLTRFHHLQSTLRQHNYPIPYQDLAIAATERGHAALLAQCLNAGAIIDADVTTAASLGSSPALYRTLMGHGWPGNVNLTLTDVLRNDCSKGTALVDFLLSAGATATPDIVVDAVRTSPNGDTTTFQALRAHGVDFKGTGALQMAAAVGNVAVARFLLDEGVDVDEVPARDTCDMREFRNGTPLVRALTEGSWGVAGLLVERGADVWRKDQRGRCAVDVARAVGREGLLGMKAT